MGERQRAARPRLAEGLCRADRLLHALSSRVRLGSLNVFQIVENVGVKITVRVVFTMEPFLDQPIPQNVEHRLG